MEERCVPANYIVPILFPRDDDGGAINRPSSGDKSWVCQCHRDAIASG